MWLFSAKEGAKGEPFRVVARALGRASAGLLHPGGMPENSPAFQRWDRAPDESSPEGTAESPPFRVVLDRQTRPSLGDLCDWLAVPSVETLGYCRFVPPGQGEDGFSVLAGPTRTPAAFGLETCAAGNAPPAPETLPLSGKVELARRVARFIRPGLTEEYSVSLDGVQQDFVIERPPPANGSLRLDLEVHGAKAEPMPGGARLVLADGARQMVYDRLSAKDARGRELRASVDLVSPRRLAVVLDDAAAEYPVRIDPTFSDANWVSLGGMPGLNGGVSAAAVDSAGNLYVGGAFTSAGSGPANKVAQWNGTSWSALGTGIQGGDGTIGPASEAVSALAVSGANLIAAGAFDVAGGVSATNIAQWDGSSWSALGLGIGGDSFGGRVLALAFDGFGNLYAGGSFDTAGGVWATNIARWDGSSWSALGLGIGGDSYVGPFTEGGPVSALACDGSGNLYAGGLFDTAGGVWATNIARWNGSSWSALGLGIGGDSYVGPPTVPPEGSPVAALAFDASGNLYAGGNFDTAGGVWATNIARWNGSSWAALGSGLSGGIVSALALDSSGNLCVGGSFTTAGTNVSPYLAKALLTGPAPNQLLLANGGASTSIITCRGTPGASYALDLATNLAPPVNWIPQTTNTASTASVATAGYVVFTNSNHLPQAYYRTRSVR